MSEKVQDLILSQLDALKAESSSQHAQILLRIDALDVELVKLRERIVTLEVQERQMRWLFAGMGGILFLAAKEAIVWFLQNMMPEVREAALQIFLHWI